MPYEKAGKVRVGWVVDMEYDGDKHEAGQKEEVVVQMSFVDVLGDPFVT